MEKLKNIFDDRKKSMPLLGASMEQRVEAKIRLNRWTYVFILALLNAGLTSYSFYVETFFGLSIYQLMWIPLSIYFVCHSYVEAALSREAKTLLNQCTDTNMLETVATKAEEHSAVKYQLRQCIRPNERDYLCWYEVFTLLDTAKKEDQASILKAIKNRINERVSEQG